MEECPSRNEQEFDPFQIAAVLAAELGAGPPQIVRSEALDADLPRRLLDHGPEPTWVSGERSMSVFATAVAAASTRGRPPVKISIGDFGDDAAACSSRPFDLSRPKSELNVVEAAQFSPH
jgi:hypothetical protein